MTLLTDSMTTWLAAGGGDGGGGMGALRVLLAIAVIAVISLISTSRRFDAAKRNPILAVLITGGWLAVGIGILVGPHGPLGEKYAIVTVEMIETVRPMIFFVLGWIGLMIGMQAHHQLPKLLPKGTVRFVILDSVVSLLVIGGVAFLVTDALGPEYRWVVTAILAVSGIGWAAETRSLTRGAHGLQHVADLLRATAGLSAMVALFVYGFLFHFYSHDPEAGADQGAAVTLVGLPWDLLIRIGLAAATVVLLGLLAYMLTKIIRPREESEFLVVLLGLVCFAAGAAVTVSFAPLFMGMLLGAVLVNLPGTSMDRFRRVILEGEHNLATALMIVAGVMAEPAIGMQGLIIVGAVLAARLAAKLIIGMVELWGLTHSGEDNFSEQRIRTTKRALMFGPLRQGPLAVAMLVGFSLSFGETGGPEALAGGRLLMIVIIVGVITDLTPLAQWVGVKQEKRNSVQRSDSP